MKYIKTYNESMSDNTIDTIKDICIELEDDGFSYYIHGFNFSNKYNLFIRRYSKIATDRTSSNNTLSFTFDEVSDVVKRISAYLGDKLVAIYALKKKTNYYNDGVDMRNTKDEWVVIYNSDNSDLDKLSPDWTNSDIYAVKLLINK